MECDRCCFFEMSLGPRTCPLEVLALWWRWGGVGGRGCRATRQHVLKEGARCKRLNGHKLFAEYLIFRHLQVDYLGLIALGRSDEVRFSQTTTEECFQ